MNNIQLNGEARDVPTGATVADLLEELGLGTRPVAVERNRAVVPRDAFDLTVLEDGDTVEVVSFVPGG
jgi:thiamine biosynthesis protein ThiS